MSVVGNNRVGIPIVLLHDAEGAIIEVETKEGAHIRGLLFEAEDMMNLYIKGAVITDAHTGQRRKVSQVYLRGNEITFIVLPDMLKHAPMFHRIQHWRKHGGAPPEGVAVGQAAAILRKANQRRQFGGRRGGGGGGGGRFGGGSRGGGRFGGGRGGNRPYGGGGNTPYTGGRGGGGGGRGYGMGGGPGTYGAR